jgi:hypothetical protein
MTVSHVTRLKTKIQDGQALLRCLAAMGYQIAKGRTIRTYGGTQAVDIAVRMPEGYEVGFSRNAEGTYDIVADWWGVRGTTQEDFAGRLQREFDQVERRIRQEYAVYVAMENLQRQGFRVVEQSKAPDGSVRLLARRW